jgi:hypothetical protein
MPETCHYIYPGTLIIWNIQRFRVSILRLIKVNKESYGRTFDIKSQKNKYGRLIFMTNNFSFNFKDKISRDSAREETL